MAMERMKYRPEIDGLRAVAVLPVLFFHAGWELFAGGFVGVDVFFVISGYLITTLILNEKERGVFSLSSFYERRARRILPALFLVMAVSCLLAWNVLVPSDMRAFAKSVVAVTTFWANFLFLRESGYWGQVNELKPLLHTWSLGVEEQFYLIFPLFLTLLWRWGKKKLLPVLALVGLTSLVAAQLKVLYQPEAAFFLLPFRAWELALGAMVAIGLFYPSKLFRALAALSTKAKDIAAGAGLLMIASAVSAYDQNTPFPGFAALLPTIGTALAIVFASPKTIVGRMLASKVPVTIGLISYSAYLWHHPLLAFARHRSLEEPSKLFLGALALLSLPLAYITWKFVEIPFRRRGKEDRHISRKALFSFVLASSTILLAVGISGVITNGFDHRRNHNGDTWQVLQERLKINVGLDPQCEQGLFLSPKCRTSNAPTIVVWGDSFAMHIVPAILASHPQAQLLQMTKSACGPFFTVAPVFGRYRVPWARGCLEFTGKVKTWLAGQRSVKFAVLGCRFDLYFAGKTLYRNGELRNASFALALQEFSKTLAELRQLGLTPVVVAPPPVTGANLGQKLAFAAWRGIPLDACNFPLSKVLPRGLEGYRFLEEVKRATNVKVIWLHKMLCDSSYCKTHLGDIFIYRDDVHLAIEGSAELGRRFDFYRLITEE